ncbi:HNH endonuclease signature motif containing protein [Enterococcus plantarum]|uniref:HNH nuclease domain-containing protein n=1 Tax=Enterococcus plantarum TaxID=1077675 RepID=A0A2W3Z7Q6_9ENTE|nr:HNH endonuclease signature motif containing protein [Enterococcus plantarum]PZL70104.1 hypothetical protein CI088_15765 [Enterococcus plantarum]
MINNVVEVKPIKGKLGYFADVDGNIYSLWINKGRHGLVMGNRFRKLNFSKSKSGHFVVSFGREDKELVHRVIYQTFVGDIEEGKFIRHLNDIKSDNRVCNLKQGTQKENMSDAMKNGVLKTKLDKEAVKTIRSLKGYKKRKEVALIYQVSENTIKQIWNFKTWKEVV